MLLRVSKSWLFDMFLRVRVVVLCRPDFQDLLDALSKSDDTHNSEFFRNPSLACIVKSLKGTNPVPDER